MFEKTKSKTFLFIPSELTDCYLLKNQIIKCSDTFNICLVGYTIPSESIDPSNKQSNNEVVLILGFYSPFTERRDVCPYCSFRYDGKIKSNDSLHVCAQSLRKYKFHRSRIKTYSLVITDESQVWISIDMNKLPVLLTHGVLMRYRRMLYSQMNCNNEDDHKDSHIIFDNSTNWLYSMMQEDIGQSLCRLILWLNRFTLNSTTIPYNPCKNKTNNNDKEHDNETTISSMPRIHYSSSLLSSSLSTPTFVPDPSLSVVSAIQLLILILCLMTVSHNHLHIDNDFKCCIPNTNDKLSIVPTCTIDGITTISTPINWLPNDLNCKIIPTLGLFYLDSNEENYSSKVLAATLSPSSSLILYNSTKELISYLSASSDSCRLNVLYRCVEYFTCELTRLLLWLENGKPAGLKINLHLAHLMGQFFLYHLLAWRSYVTFIIYLLIYLLSKLQEFTEINSSLHNEYILMNVMTVLCLLISTVYLMSSIEDYYNVSMIKVFIVYFSTIIRLMLGLFICLILDTIELITLHLTSFYIYATHLLRLQLKTISASWRLCRNSSKWNPLRNRVDKIPDMYIDSDEFLISVSSLRKKISSSSPSSPTTLSSTTKHLDNKNHQQQANIPYEFVSHKKDSDIILSDQLTGHTCGIYLDRLLVSTLLGLAIGLCLFSTTITFYITFTSVQLVLLLVKNRLKRLVWFIMDFPLESFLCWLINSPVYQTKLILEAPKMNSKPFLEIKITRIDFSEMYAQNHLLHKSIFPTKCLSFNELFNRLITAQDIR
ncbi:Phosphatidylinositol N-acetylglucosaminyltransferase subunit Q [Schistosoma japonicum]|nr:Phosphatidylinositol N-acetylglucosaminyltransferase subunit Q [Schistosoma japonicum]KAH8858719.1 Phosphatidylinositol N-acetylglucosaminyltransferase subunit Q [Schistosoma japonicum]